MNLLEQPRKRHIGNFVTRRQAPIEEVAGCIELSFADAVHCVRATARKWCERCTNGKFGFTARVQVAGSRSRYAVDHLDRHPAAWSCVTNIMEVKPDRRATFECTLASKS